MHMVRLFTVVIESSFAMKLDSMTLTPGKSTAEYQPIYECDFAGIHFSRRNDAVLRFWVRMAARHVYGKHTQVIFLHEERKDNGTQ